MTESFDSFISEVEEVPFEEFLASWIAEQGCIERSWWSDVTPVSFYVIQKHCWIAKFADGGCYTMIEREEYEGTFDELARILFNWYENDCGEH